MSNADNNVATSWDVQRIDEFDKAPSLSSAEDTLTPTSVPASLPNGHGVAESSELQSQPTHIPLPSYPTNSLNFLKLLDNHANGTHQTLPVPAKVPLNIIVAGAGLGGLATAIALARRGHRVTVYEQASTLGEVGAGIQMPSNSTRLLLSWGLGPYLGDRVIEPASILFRRWQSGEVIGHTRLVPDFRKNFDAPYYVIHRAHFHDALHRLALDLGVTVKVNSKVAEYDPAQPSLRLESGETYTADLIVAADGLRSKARPTILKGADRVAKPTGFAAYRGVIGVEEIRAHPELAWLIDEPNLNLWIGDKRHVMTYMIAGGKTFNMVLSHPEERDPAEWHQETANKEMRSHFEGWDPRLTKLIDMITTTLKWSLVSGQPLQKWVDDSGKLLILGDAAHAMVPYMSQGAGMAVEDGAALAEALNHMTSSEELSSALRIFQDVRIPRANQMQEASLVNGKLWHFADGPEQQARDAAMKPEVEDRHFVESPNQWSDPVTQAWTYGYDAEREVRRACARDSAGSTKAKVNGLCGDHRGTRASG